MRKGRGIVRGIVVREMKRKSGKREVVVWRGKRSPWLGVARRFRWRCCRCGLAHWVQARVRKGRVELALE